MLADVVLTIMNMWHRDISPTDWCSNAKIRKCCQYTASGRVSAAWTDEWAEELIEKVIWFKDFKPKLCTVHGCAGGTLCAVSDESFIIPLCVCVVGARALVQRKGIPNEFEHVELMFVYLFVILYRCIVLAPMHDYTPTPLCACARKCLQWLIRIVCYVVVVIHRFFYRWISMNVFVNSLYFVYMHLNQ